MRLISLNLWGGRMYEPLIEFIKVHSVDTDIFCFQEIFSTTTDMKQTKEARANLYQELQALLVDFNGYFDPAQDGFDQKSAVDFPLSFGIATFTKKSLNLKSHGDIFVFRERDSRKDDNTSIGRNLQYAVLENDGKEYAIFNLHGLWDGGPKTDTEDRIQQSEKTKKFMKEMKIERSILCGDFNLMPDTKSLAILEDGMINLVKENRIQTTRNHFYTKEEKFADYILVSPAVQVKDFQVLQDVVSDHLPLLLDFE